jgi:CrcB protein
VLRGSTATPLSRAAARLPPTLLVAVGGFIGAVLRHLVGAVVTDPLAATLAVSVVGSFALGVVVAAAPGEGTRLLPGVGACGAFTTCSSFSYETVRLARRGRPPAAAVNAVGTLVACLAAVRLAWLLGG